MAFWKQGLWGHLPTLWGHEDISHEAGFWQPLLKRCRVNETDSVWAPLTHRHCSHTYLWSSVGFSLLAIVLTFWHGFCLDNGSPPPLRRWRTCYTVCSTCSCRPCLRRFPARAEGENKRERQPQVLKCLVSHSIPLQMGLATGFLIERSIFYSTISFPSSSQLCQLLTSTCI